MLVNNRVTHPYKNKTSQDKRVPKDSFAENTIIINPKNNLNQVNASQIVSFFGKKIKESLDSITLMYITDTHRNLSRMPKLKTAVENFRNASDNSIVLSAGDYSMGNKGIQFHAKMLDRIGVDIATLGNHEFFSGYEELTTAITNSDFQTVVSNLQVSKDNPLNELFNNGKLSSSSVKVINGKKYGFVGVTTPDLYKYPKYLEDSKILDPIFSVAKEVKDLEAQGIDRIILISHLGVNLDRQIAQKVKGIDVIVGGHDHKALVGINKGINLFEHIRKDGSKEPVIILHGGAHNNLLGVGHLVFNQDGLLKVNNVSSATKFSPFSVIKNLIIKIKSLITTPFTNSTTNKLVDIRKYKDNKDIAKIVQQEQLHYNKLTTINRAITKSWPVWKEDQIGKLIADSVREYTGADISMVQNGCIKRGLDKGVVYQEYIDDFVIPFNSPLVKIKATGAEILKGLNIGADSIGIADHDIGVVQVSGMKYSIDMKRDEGSKVLPENVMILINGKYELIKPDKEYKVAIDEYIYKGGSGFDAFKNSEKLETFEGKGFPKVLTAYIKKHSDNLKFISPDNNKNIYIKHHKNLNMLNPKKFVSNYLESKKEIMFNA